MGVRMILAKKIELNVIAIQQSDVFHLKNLTKNDAIKKLTQSNLSRFSSQPHLVHNITKARGHKAKKKHKLLLQRYHNKEKQETTTNTTRLQLPVSTMVDERLFAFTHLH